MVLLAVDGSGGGVAFYFLLLIMYWKNLVFSIIMRTMNCYFLRLVVLWEAISNL